MSVAKEWIISSLAFGVSMPDFIVDMVSVEKQVGTVNVLAHSAGGCLDVFLHNIISIITV